MPLRRPRRIAGLALTALGIGVLALALLHQPRPEPPGAGGMTDPTGSAGPRFLGVVDEPSSARLCDPELWQGIDSIVIRNEPGRAWVAEARWRTLSSRSRAAVANWASQCTSSGTPLALVGSPSGNILGHYSPEKGLAHRP